jgi:hypothetical protein
MARNPKRIGKGLQSLIWWFNSIPCPQLSTHQFKLEPLASMTNLMESAQRTGNLPLPSRMEDYFFKNGRTVLNEKRPPRFTGSRGAVRLHRPDLERGLALLPSGLSFNELTRHGLLKLAWFGQVDRRAGARPHGREQPPTGYDAIRGGPRPVDGFPGRPFCPRSP